MSSALQDFYLGDARQGRSDRFSIPLDGSHLSIGPFSFRPRSIVLVNQTIANLIAEDDRGEQYIAAQSVGATYGTSDTMRFECWIDKPVTSGKCSVVVSEEPAGIAAAQLSSFAGVGGSGTFKRVALGSFPPASPADGDAIALAIAANLEWALIYNAATGFWDKIGGPPIIAEVNAREAIAVVAYSALATAGPSILVPRPGDYIIEAEADVDSAAGRAIGFMSYDLGGVAAVDADAAEAPGGDFQFNTSARKRRRHTGVAAATNIVSKYRGSVAATNVFFANRSLSIDAERIQ